MIGQTLAERYHIVAVIGQGGMGRVYRAKHTGLADRHVAVKVLRARLGGNKKAIARFKREAQVLSRMSHPHTVRVFDSGMTDDGFPFIVTELLDGLSVADVLQRDGEFSAERLVHVADQVLKALSEAHAAGIVHRDISTGNIFLCDVHGERDFVKLLDFGVCRDDGGSKLTKTGEILGTPLYMSPEQAQGFKTDARSDIYSLGAVLYELLTGAPMFSHANPVLVQMAHVNDTPPSLLYPGSDVPPNLAAILMQCLAKDPDDRPENADSVRAGLAGAVAGRTIDPIGVTQPVSTVVAALDKAQEESSPGNESATAWEHMAIQPFPDSGDEVTSDSVLEIPITTRELEAEEAAVAAAVAEEKKNTRVVSQVELAPEAAQTVLDREPSEYDLTPPESGPDWGLMAAVAAAVALLGVAAYFIF